MGSDLYRIKVVEKQDRTVKLRVEVVHPDSNYLSDGLSFALMVLREGTTAGTPAPLAQEISFDDTMDRGWLELYTRGFIERAETKVESGSSEGQTQADWIKGTLTITVTDPAWIAHLVVGNEFDSRSFDVTSDFADCKPIHPGQVDPNAPMPEAFISVPGAMWEGQGLPTVVRAAAYSASAYRSIAPRKGTFTAADLKDLDGQVVLKQGEYDESPQLATLHLNGESVQLFSVSDGGHGSSGGTGFEGTIGKAELIPGKRLGSRLKLSRMLGNLKPNVLSAVVAGDSTTFRIAVPPANTSLESLGDDQLIALGFQLFVSPLFPKESGLPTLLSPSPLSWTIEREVLRLFPAEERQISNYIDGKMVPAGDSMPEQSGLARKLARGFIAKTELLSKPAASSSGGVDALTEAQQRETLLAPWPEMVVKVTAHHAVFQQHLASFEPLILQYVSEAEAWEGAPATPATAPTEFGKSTPPPPRASSAPSSSSAPASSSSGGPNKMLKIVGIGCGVLVALMLFCLILGALVGK